MHHSDWHHSDWHILGAGAIGGLWALRLIASGQSVSLIASQATSAQRHLSLQNGDTITHHTFPVESLEHISPIKHLLITTKTSVTESALQPIIPYLSAKTPILFLQNGMGSDDRLRRERPDLIILNGITTDGVFRRTPDELVLAGKGETWIGATESQHQTAAQDIVSLLYQAHPSVFFAHDIQQRRWLKLAINCVINPLTAIYRCHNGEILKHPEIQHLLLPLCTEIAAVMTAEGYPIDASFILNKVRETAQKTALNISSMYADVLAQRETEINAMNAFIVHRGHQHNINTPINQELVNSLITHKD